MVVLIAAGYGLFHFLGSGTGSMISGSAEHADNAGKAGNLPSCVTEQKLVQVRGSSLSGLIEPGDMLRLLVGYYKCMPVERGDIVAYNYAGNDVPVIKVVKGIEGDRFELKENDSCWNILVNGEIVKNSQGIPYCISGNGYKMLHLYEVDYKGVIPSGANLLLGNSPSGTTDSTRFGLVDRLRMEGVSGRLRSK